jgi:hypothetical protein
LLTWRIEKKIDMSNPRVFFDITIGGKAAGRVIFELNALTGWFSVASNLLDKLQYLKLLKISELFALEKEEWENKENPCILRDLASTESFLVLCAKEETSPRVTVPEASLSMETNSRTKTSN